MSKYLNYILPSTVATAAVLTLAYNFADRNVTPMPAAVDTASVAPAAITAATAAAHGGMKLGLGRPATEDEVAAWDGDVAPDGTGLPVGSGDVWTGDELFADQCAVCHGDFAEGRDNWPKLAGGMDTLDHDDPLKTVGSYWPYLSTAFDYIKRSMPFGNAGTLSDDDTYAILAYILYSNDLIDDDFVLSNETFFDVEMPNADGFFVDNRAETEYAAWSGEPCMENCKDSVEITMRAAVLDVTPEESGVVATGTVEEEAAVAPAPTPAAKDETQMAAAPAEDAAPVVAAAFDPALAAEGEKVYRKCKACHQVGDGAANKTGPVLNGIIGRAAGTVDGFRYSPALMDKAGEGLVWNEAEMAAFLEKPKDYIPKTKMSFAGLRDADDIKAVIEYLKQFNG